jgi:hypothetical protein
VIEIRAMKRIEIRQGRGTESEAKRKRRVERGK